MITKIIATRKNHTNELNAKLGRPVEYRMHAIKNHLHYRVKGALHICEDCAMKKKNQKLLHKLAEERDLNPGEMIYLDSISQKKPSYGGSNNWILIQD